MHILPRWIGCSQVLCISLVVFVSAIPTSFQLLGQARGKGTCYEVPDFLSHRGGKRALHLSTERPARETGRRFSCYTDSPLHRGCSSLSSPGFPVAITLSRLIIRASVAATGRIPKNSRTRSITTPRSRITLRSARAGALHALYAGLRRPRGLSHGLSPSGPNRGSHAAGCCRTQRRVGGELEDAAGVLARTNSRR
jgi:hypothetical protein